jgi:hypothetical protein
MKSYLLHLNEQEKELLIVEIILFKNLCHVNFVNFLTPKIQTTVDKVVHKW